MIIRLKIDTRMHARLSIYLLIVNCHFYSMRDYMIVYAFKELNVDSTN